MQPERIKRTLVEPLRGRAVLSGIIHISGCIYRNVHQRPDGSYWTELVLPRNKSIWSYEEDPVDPGDIAKKD